MLPTKKTTELHWQIIRFKDFSAYPLYQLMQLRVDVFVVEQNCVYRELDDLDLLPDTLHIMGYASSAPGAQLLAYARAIAPHGPLHDETDDQLRHAAETDTGVEPAAAVGDAVIKIGRVAVHAGHRRQGHARRMMLNLLQSVRAEWPGHRVCLNAQTAVTAFYQSLGFHKVSGEYLDDGIPHINMISSHDFNLKL